MPSKDKQEKIVCNSSPIINLSKIDRLDLIEKLYREIIIPEAVFKELIVMGSDKEYVPAIKSLIENNIIVVRQVKSNDLVRAFEKDLDFGEAEVISLALEINANFVIIDERDARETAAVYGLEKTGFIGILMKAKQEGLIDSVKRYLDMAIDKGFWIDEKLYRSIMREIVEQ